MSDLHLPETKIPESSAYNNNLFFTTADMSFTYIKNRRGPRIDPCGTPQEIPAVNE